MPIMAFLQMGWKKRLLLEEKPFLLPLVLCLSLNHNMLYFKAKNQQISGKMFVKMAKTGKNYKKMDTMLIKKIKTLTFVSK